MYSVVPKGSLGGYTGGGLWGLAFLGSRLNNEFVKSPKNILSKLGLFKNENGDPVNINYIY